MPAYDLMFPRIKDTKTGTGNQTITLDKDYQGIIIDNQSASNLTYTINSIDRIVPNVAIRGLLLDNPFDEINIVASGYYEIHIF